MLFIYWLTKITDDPVVEGARPVNVIGVGGHEDCRNSMSRIEEVFVELDSGDRRHLDISDQTGGFNETRDARNSAADEKVSMG
jgi:hypothetical protein